MSLKTYQTGQKDFYVDSKVRKVLILGESGVGKTRFARNNHVLDLDAFVYQRSNKEWDHFSFVEDYIKDAYGMFAVAHHVRDSIKELFDVVIDTREYEMKRTHEQVLATYIRDHIRGFNPVYCDTNHFGTSFEVIASDIKSRYSNSFFCANTWKFRFAEYLILKYNEKQQEKYDFVINVLEHNWRTQDTNTVFTVAKNLYRVAYGEHEFLVEVCPEPKKEIEIGGISSSINHFSEHLLFNPRSMVELRTIKSLDESERIYHVLVEACCRVETYQAEFAAKFLTGLIFYMNEIAMKLQVESREKEHISANIDALIQSLIRNRK